VNEQAKAMECDQANKLISARLDGEISAEDAALLEGHLPGCADCRSAADAMAADHALLTRAFELRREAAAMVAERVIQRFPARRRISMRWLSPVIAAAAGFLLAVFVFQPWTKNRIPSVQTSANPAIPVATRPTSLPSPSPIAHLALATGKVEILPKETAFWCPMPTGGDVPPEARVRTGPGVRCEFACADGSKVRLNEGTELHFAGSRKFELAEGQVWSGVEPSKIAFTVAVPNGNVTALGTRFDLSSRAGKSRLIVIDGRTRVQGGNDEVIVNAGEQMEMEAGRLGRPERMYALQTAERWIDEILVLKGRDNPELNQHIDDLMAQLGSDKMQYLYESEIRGLGDHCVVPLTRYIQSDRSKGEAEKRQRAARIISDCAQPWCVPYLIELLSDTDADVRNSAASGLQRVTGREGRPPDWRSTPLRMREQWIEKWKQWWEENHDHIPGSKQNAPPQHSNTL
jgi:ferric-dicitrate binding protein FerR (iron transport regulator)